MTVQSILDNASKAIALVSFSILLLTVIHDWGYFWVLGLRFQSMQTPYDYLANSIEWLPYHLATLFLTGSLTVFSVTVTERPEYPSGIRNRKAQMGLLASVLFALFAVLVSFAVFFLMHDVSAILLVMGFAYPLVVISLDRFTWMPSNSRIERFAVLLPALVLITFGFGARSAEYAVRSTENVYRLDLKNLTTVSSNLLRSMEKGALIWDEATQRASLVRWEQIERISHVVGNGKSEDSHACHWFGFFCHNVSPTP